MANPIVVDSAGAGATVDAIPAVALTVPAGAAAGDYMIYGVDFNVTGTVTAPDPGGGAMALLDSANTNGNIFAFVYHKVLVAGDLGGTVQASNSVGAATSAVLIVISGSTGAIDIMTAATLKSTNNTTVSFPAVAPTVNDCLHIYLGFESPTALSTPVGMSTPAGYTELQDVTSSGASNSRRIGAVLGYKALTGQAGVTQGPLSATDVTSSHEITWTLTVAPGTATNVNAGNAAATGAAFDTGNGVFAGAAEATATGTAPFDTAGGTTDLQLTALNPVNGTGQALDPVAFLVSFGATEATGTGAAGDVAPALSVFPAEAAGTGQSVQPSISGGSNVPAGLAAGTGAANDTSISMLINAAISPGFGDAIQPGVTPGAIPLGVAAPLSQLMAAWFLGQGVAAGSLSDMMLRYFAGLSGLPSGSLTDHMRAYYASQTGLPGSATSFTTLELAYWALIDGTNIIGSWADRARRYYATP